MGYDLAKIPAQQAHRFGWVLSGQSTGPALPFDIDLGQESCAAIAPTKGAIVPDWLLVIPREPAYCVKALPSNSQAKIADLIWRIEAQESSAHTAYFFEHGANHSTSTLGCGVDQAHLHLVWLENLNLINAAASSEHIWREVDVRNPWAEIPAQVEYYLVSDFKHAYVALPMVTESQFFRKLIATGLGRAEEWDYRQYPNERNAVETTRRYSNNRKQQRFE